MHSTGCFYTSAGYRLKPVALVEGKNDLEFFYHYFNRCEPQGKVKKFENTLGSQQKDAESRELQRFLDENSPCQVLIKAESGKSNLFIMFRYMLPYFLELDAHLLLIFDLDHKDPSSFLEEFE